MSHTTKLEQRISIVSDELDPDLSQVIRILKSKPEYNVNYLSLRSLSKGNDITNIANWEIKDLHPLKVSRYEYQLKQV